MSKVTYDVECLYRGRKNEPDQWETWMADYPEDAAKNILTQGQKLAKQRDCLFKACRLVKVTREVI